MEKALTVIPAKSRSTRLPDKNMRLVGGRPLVLRAVDQALAAGVCGEICVATDGEATAAAARQAGAKTPFLRRDDVDDVTPVGTAALNVLERYREELGRSFEYICLLLATSPLRLPEDIRQCFELLEADPEADAAMSVVRAEKHPAWAWKFEDQDRISPMFPDICDLARNQLPPAYFIDGAVYWARADFFERSGGDQYAGRVIGYPIPAERAVDVDTALDLTLAEILDAASRGDDQ